MVNTRNILIVGITGSGKSTLANILVDKEVFKESSGGTSETGSFQKSNFEWNRTNYYVIDNVGFGDNRDELVEETVLYEIGKAVYSAKEGINQVFFVFKDKFSPEQIKNFNLFKELISESGITKYTTLVRTNFINFRNHQECENDQQVLLSENREIREIIEACNGVLHVDNPQIPIIDSEDSEEEIEDKKGKISRNERKRKESREKALNHLAECHSVYKLKEWDNIYSIVANYIEKEGEIERSNSLTKKEELEKEKNKAIATIKIKLEAELSKVSELSSVIEHKQN